MLKIQDLTGNRLKKSLSLFQAVKRYHNRNNSGGNFAFNLYFDEKHSRGLSFEISGYHDTTGAITEIRFGYLWKLGAKVDNKYYETFDKLIKYIQDILKGLSLFQVVAKCEVCDNVIISDIAGFKAQNCTQCESYIETCRGATETITLCKECCHEDFVEQGNENSRAFYGVMTDNREDMEESDLVIGEG